MANKKSIPFHFITGLRLSIKEEEDRFSQESNIALNSPSFKKYIEDFRRQKDIDCNKFNAMVGQINSVDIPDIGFKAERLSRKLKTQKEQKKLEKWLSEQLPKEIEYRKSKECRQRLQLQKKYEDKILRIKEWIDKRLTMEDIHSIRRRFKLSEAWDFPLLEYILTGRMSKPSARCSVSLVGLPRHKRRLFINCTWDASIDDIRDIWGTVKESQKLLPDLDRKNPSIFIDNGELKIEIYKHTAIEDIRHKWSIIEEHQKTLPDFKPKVYRYKRNLERDKQWQEWFKEGKKEQEIYNNLTPYEDLRKKNGNIITPQAIRKARERYRKRMIK